MKIRVIRAFLGDRGIVQPGAVLEVSEIRARELEQKKLAVPLIPAKIAERLGGSKGVASEGAPRPTQTPQTGGQTGEATLASSLPPDQAPQKRRSKRRRAKPN